MASSVAEVELVSTEEASLDTPMKTEPPKKDSRKASVFELFSTADSIDVGLMVLGTLGGMGTGFSLPAFNVLFGLMLDNLNDDPNSLVKGVNQIAEIFVYVAIGNFFCGFLQVACWSYTGERQTQRLREQYVQAILKQEIGWFDEEGAGELSTRVAELAGKVQDGIGRKVGDFCQYFAQVVGSFAAAFYLSWKLTLVLMAGVPLIGLAGSFMITSIAAAKNESFEQYAAAGGLASEVLNGIRTATALNIQPAVVEKYRKFLVDAMNVGILKGRNVGIGNGGLFFAAFMLYALGFW